jgi:CrcB protein
MILAALTGLTLRIFLVPFSWGLLTVNVFGSFAAGALAGSKFSGNPWVTAGVIGFCGCLTTFSGYALENVKLFEQGEIFKVALNFFLHNALCLFVCYSGWRLVQKL